MSTQAEQVRALLDAHTATLAAVGRLRNELGEVFAEPDDKSLYYEARGELRDAIDHFKDALTDVRMLTISLEHCK